MAWRILKRRLGKAGNQKQRSKRKRNWDLKYGQGLWAIGYIVDKNFILQEEALELVYYRSYEEHFKNNEKDLNELIRLAKRIKKPHAIATNCVDLQVPVIMQYLNNNNLKLMGNEIVDIGSWNGAASHSISIRLSPLHIKVVGNPKQTLEKFWQEKKCLAIWDD